MKCSELIENKVYLGSIVPARSKATLKRLNIVCVVNCAIYDNPVLKELNIPEIRVDVEDAPPEKMWLYFEPVFEFIETVLKELKGAVLFHCFAGKSRSPAMAMSYLMKKRGMSLFQAAKMVEQKRKSVAPNCGFIYQLSIWEMFLRENKIIKKTEGEEDEDMEWKCVADYFSEKHSHIKMLDDTVKSLDSYIPYWKKKREREMMIEERMRTVLSSSSDSDSKEKVPKKKKKKVSSKRKFRIPRINYMVKKIKKKNARCKTPPKKKKKRPPRSKMNKSKKKAKFPFSKAWKRRKKTK